MTDVQPAPPAPQPGLLRSLAAFLASDKLLARATVLGLLMLVLLVPLSMIGGAVTDRRIYQREATQSVTQAWGEAQTFAGPLMVLPYFRTVEGREQTAALTLLPEKLSIDGRLQPEKRRRGLFDVNVYTATLDVVAEFDLKAVRDLASDNRRITWQDARLQLGVSDSRSIEGSGVEVDGRIVDWTSGPGAGLSSLRAAIGPEVQGGRDRIMVRFRITLAGSTTLSLVPLGGRTEVSLAAPWPSPSFIGRLPISQSIEPDGFRARWSVSHLGRPYGQLWDSAANEPQPSTVLRSAFGATLLTPIDAYRETDRAIKYAVMFIGLTLVTCLMFELATGTRPYVAQYGLIGLALCVFYLLLLSIAEQIGFGPAYFVSAAAVVAQATAYNWALLRRTRPALLFGAILAGLYGGLYGLLQLEDVALLSGSLLLFAVLSVAMWLTRNLHRPQPA